MNMEFNLFTPTKLLFGRGKLNELANQQLPGKHALLLKIYCTDHDHLMSILVHTIQNIPYIAGTDTMISLDQAIERQVWVDDVPVKES